MEPSLSEVNELAELFLAKKKEVEKIEEEVISPLQKQIQEIQSKLVQALEANNLKKFSGSNGSIHLVVDKKVDMPKGDDKEKFVQFMKDRGEWDAFATVHHATLNSWFKEQMENDPLFVAPGLGLPKENKYLKRGR